MPTYNKLVRDRIPEIIEAQGKMVKARTLDDSEYLEALIEKVSEELAEFKAEPSAEELADLQEVLLALADALSISHEELEKVRVAKATKRGAFKDKIFLVEADK